MNIPNCHQRNYKVLIFLLKRKYRCGPNIEPWVYSSANFGPFTIWDFLYLGFWVFVKSKHLKNLSRDDKHCYTMEVTFRLIFFWILSIVKMKFGQTLVCCMANISNMFMSQCCRLETSSTPFYNFIKMKISSYLASFNNWHLPFLIFHYSSLKKKRNVILA